MKKNDLIAAIIQARMGSQRFPGKVMKKIFGKPVIQLQIERLKKSKYINKIIVSTSLNKKDYKIKEFCEKKMNIDVYRGSEKDVLDRVSKTIKKFRVGIHVECFGDSPLIDPSLIDEFILKFKKSNADCLTNTLKTTYPPGQEIMIYKGSKLLQLNKIIKKKDPFREHVGFNFTRFKGLFTIKNIIAPKRYFFPNIYLEVDKPIDLVFIKKIYEYFDSKKKNYFSLRDILVFLNKNKKLYKLNRNVFRRWKLLKNEKKI